MKRHLAALLVLAMALCGGCAPQERQEMGGASSRDRVDASGALSGSLWA